MYSDSGEPSMPRRRPRLFPRARRIPKPAIVFLVIAAAGGAPMAQGQPAPDFSSFCVGLTYHSLDYRESEGGAILDKDTGSLWGFHVDWRRDFRRVFVASSLSFSATSSATYDGFLQDGSGNAIPYSFDTEPESFFLLRANLGYKAAEAGSITISPVVGFGYRDWVRGKDDYSTYDYREDYYWFFADGGLRLDAKRDRWRFGLQGEIAYPIAPRMETDMNGEFPAMTFSLGAVPAFLAEGSIRYDFAESYGQRFFLAIQPFYQRWGIGKSNTIVATDAYDGNQYAIDEPKSATSIYGLTLGLGISFL